MMTTLLRALLLSFSFLLFCSCVYSLVPRYRRTGSASTIFARKNVQLTRNTGYDGYSSRIRRYHPFVLAATTDILPDTEAEAEEKVLVITPKAMDHLAFLKSKQESGMILRMGVRAGGCSGMSYVMDFVKEGEITDDDHVEEYDGIRCVVDPKSLLFIYGMKLDYSDELIGGGFKFSNPNAETSCGCGKSFGV
jgi:iron-sulfur cluster assembly protein